MQKRNLLLVFLAMVLAVLMLPLFAAYEAHVINVTAKIENALTVLPTEIAFGTVFPQETHSRTFQVKLSQSFIDEDRVDDVHYKLVQKPKPKGDPRAMIYPTNFSSGIPAWDYCYYLNQQADPEYLTYCYLNLCPLLNKVSAEGEEDTEGSAWLHKAQADLTDTWTIFLDVPCVEGYTPQGEECPTVPQEGDYGCDIWVEVQGISQTP